MQDGRREAIHNPPQGKATQGGEQHGYEPSEKWTNPTTRANGNRGGKKGRRDKRRPGRTQSLLSSAFPLGLDKMKYLSKSLASNSTSQYVFVRMR